MKINSSLSHQTQRVNLSVLLFLFNEMSNARVDLTDCIPIVMCDTRILTHMTIMMPSGPLSVLSVPYTLQRSESGSCDP